ncbi:MAG: YwaF family protein [Muribaculaceae bacterium]|nr:YwaF family protein [Roseburia sp.]MCM1430463.1 YwaF family protein [Muribaculaceae bacterium]MCM1493136.1 YwaF family protein [Muribaculaceae bacterium]
MELEYFFTYETEIPEGIGFAVAGKEHILWLFFLAGISLLLMRLYAGLPERGRCIWEYIVAFSMVFWVLIRIVYIAVIGKSFLPELPLHLCSIAGILCAVHCVARWDWLGNVLYSIGLPGTVLALLFPNWGKYPAIHFITIEGFLFHAGILLYVVSQLYSRGIVPKPGKLWQVVLFLAAVAAPVYCFDRCFHVNYMFVNWPSPGSPLELLEECLGNPGYLAGYAFFVLLGMFLMDLGYVLFTKKD